MEISVECEHFYLLVVKELSNIFLRFERRGTTQTISCLHFYLSFRSWIILYFHQTSKSQEHFLGGLLMDSCRSIIFSHSFLSLLGPPSRRPMRLPPGNSFDTLRSATGCPLYDAPLHTLFKKRLLSTPAYTFLAHRVLSQGSIFPWMLSAPLHPPHIPPSGNETWQLLSTPEKRSKAWSTIAKCYLRGSI